MCLYKIDKIFLKFMHSEVGQIPWEPMGTPRNPLPTDSVGKTIFNKTGQTMIKSVWHRIWSTRVHKWKKKGWIVSIRWRLAAFGFCVKIFTMLRIVIVFIIWRIFRSFRIFRVFKIFAVSQILTSFSKNTCYNKYLRATIFTKL